MRFGNKEDVIEEFNKLEQEKGVNEYVERFEELKSLMCALNPSILAGDLLHNKFFGCIKIKILDLC